MDLCGTPGYPTLDIRCSNRAAFLKPVAKYTSVRLVYGWEGGHEWRGRLKRGKSPRLGLPAARPRRTGGGFKNVFTAAAVSVGAFAAGVCGAAIFRAVAFVAAS